MPRDGSGVYSPPSGTTAVSTTTISSTAYNAFIADLTTLANEARPVSAGGTGGASPSAARTGLGLAIGSDVQAYDATLTSIAALGTAANKGAYTTGVDTWAEFDLTAAGRALLDDADAAAQRTTLGLGALAVEATVFTALIDDDAVTTAKLADTAVTTAKVADDAVTPAKLSVGLLGEGQTWQDVSGSRTAGTSYQNTTGGPIAVSVRASNSTSSDLQVSTDNATWVTIASTIQNGQDIRPIFAIVPSSHYYRLSNAGTTIGTWAELR